MSEPSKMVMALRAYNYAHADEVQQMEADLAALREFAQSRLGKGHRFSVDEYDAKRLGLLDSQGNPTRRLRG